MKEKIYYYADKPRIEDVEYTLNRFINKHDWNGLIELNPNLDNILKEIINKLMWYKDYENDIQSKSEKKLNSKEINQKYIEFTERLKDDLRVINRYLDKPVNIDLPNTSPSILKELEDILKNSKFSKTNISKILNPLKEFSKVEKLRGNEVYEIKKSRDLVIKLLRANRNVTLKEFLKNKPLYNKK